MASSATPEAIEIRRRGRQRLIGAIALVALLVVFVPMLLDKEPKPAANGPALAIPPKDNAPPMPLPAPAKAAVEPAKPVAEAPAKAVTSDTPPKPASTDTPPKPVADAPAVQAAPAPAVPTMATKPPAAAKVEAKPATAAPAPPKATAASPAPTTAAQPPKAGFAVQVGAFRDDAKLKQARDKLAAAKVPHYTERLDAKGGNLTRLRAGPFDTREQAEAALAALKRNALDGKVVPLP